MGRGWALEDGRLVEAEGPAEARVEVMDADDLFARLEGAREREALSQLEHAAIPFVERTADLAAGVVVLPTGTRPASQARRVAFVLRRDQLLLADDDGLCVPVLGRLAEEGLALDTPAAVLVALLRAPLRDHPAKLSRVRDDLERLEERILAGRERVDRALMMADTRRLLGLDAFYQGMSDLADDLAEDGWEVVDARDRLRLRQLSRQLDRLSVRLESLQDYALQVHGLYQESIGVRQNDVMQWLTVVATIAMPLTVVTGWYGMNFPHMAALGAPWGYPLVAVLCAAVVACEVVVFRRRGWLRFGSPRGRDARRGSRGGRS